MLWCFLCCCDTKLSAVLPESQKSSICFESSSPKNGETGHREARPLTPSLPPADLSRHWDMDVKIIVTCQEGICSCWQLSPVNRGGLKESHWSVCVSTMKKLPVTRKWPLMECTLSTFTSITIVLSYKFEVRVLKYFQFMLLYTSHETVCYCK